MQASERSRGRARRTKAFVGGLALVGAGAAAGGIVATASAAGAATSSSTSSTATKPDPSSCRPPAGARGGPPGRLPDSGTVTAVGAATVTIKTSTGTTTYAVTSASHLMKGGPAKLSAIKVGDHVVFSTVKSNGTVAIGTLLDGRPLAGPGPGGPGGPNGPGGPPPSVGTSSAAA